MLYVCMAIGLYTLTALGDYTLYYILYNIYILYSIPCAILNTLYIAMATGCGYGCGWGYILYSLCSIIYIYIYSRLYSYMVICQSGYNAMCRIYNYETVWLCYMAVIYMAIERYDNKVTWLYGCMATRLCALKDLDYYTLCYILHEI